MPRAHWEDGAEIVRNDLNAVSKAVQREFYDRVAYELVQRAENSFFQDSFICSYSSANQFIVKKGVGFMSDVSQVSPEPQKRLLYRSADVTKIITSPDSVNSRIDVVCVKALIVDELSGSRKYKDATTSVITNQSLVIQKDWEAEVLIVDGTPSGSPVAPAVPSGYLKIAEIVVTAITGIVNGAAITDFRSLMPLGSSTTVNTTGFQRLPAGAAKTLTEIFTSLDAQLKNAYFNYFDIDEIDTPTAEPSSPAADKRRIFFRDDVLYIKNSSGSKVPVGSGGGGGGGANWVPVAVDGAVPDTENNEKVFLFESAALQSISLFFKVPASYITGRKLSLIIEAYSPSATNNFRLQSVATLVRKNVDAITSVANQFTADLEITNTLANQLREFSLDLSNAAGQINSVAIQAGHIIKIELKRINAATNEDTDQIRVIPSTTEVTI